MTQLTDYQDRTVHLTPERWRHILDHPELADMRTEIERAVREPELVIRSRSDTSAVLFYRHQRGTIVGDKWLCAVIKCSKADAFVLTACSTDKPKKGDTLWPKE